jgi:hypothetical protein
MTGVAEGDALSELLGLKKLLSRNLGDAVGVGAGVVVGSVFDVLLERLVLGDSAVTGEAAVSVGEPVASAVLCWLCFLAGEGDSAGNSAGTAT